MNDAIETVEVDAVPEKRFDPIEVRLGPVSIRLSLSRARRLLILLRTAIDHVDEWDHAMRRAPR